MELGSIPTKVSYTPTMECSSNYTQNKTASIFRPWDSLNAVGTMTTSTTVEEEIFLESTEPTNIHIPADLLKDTEITEEPLNIGALHTFLKSEVRECDLQFVRVLEKSVIQAYESYK
ncbi:GSCOCG00010570001-RA-CDS, partial [Cotesia congregata]